MATIGNDERGLREEIGGVGDQPTVFGRATDNRGVPTTPYSDNSIRYVMYRFEDTAKPAPESAYKKIYPFLRPLPFPKGFAAPDRIPLSAGIVAVRVKPEGKPAQEATVRSAPPIAQAPRRSHQPRRLPPPPLPPPLPQRTSAQPPGPIKCPPGQGPTTSGKACGYTKEYGLARDEASREQDRRSAIRDYTDATLDEGFENAARVAKWASRIIPGPAGRVFKVAEAVFDGVHEAYVAAKLVEELVFEMDQPDAMSKGTKELAKKGEDVITKIAEKKLAKILKRKGIILPKSVKKEIIKRARELFDKQIRDPAIEKGRKEFKEHMDPQERDKSLWEQWKDKWDRATGNRGLLWR